MKVIDLRCGNGHAFEGWFGSEEDFLRQNGGGQVECPLCADRSVTRMPSAPRLNLSGAREPVPVPAPATATPEPQAVDLQAAWMAAVRHLMAHTEDVGARFAEEARRIHYGEAAQRGIRGQTSPEERAALADEGIEVMSIPVPKALKGPVQ
jgi:hypothetical protein